MKRRRYELTDHEWSILAPLPPNKPHSVPRVDDRRVRRGHGRRQWGSCVVGGALLAKLTPQKADGSRILPAYISDNYITLMPGETRQLTVTYPASAAGSGTPTLAIRGWNIQPASTGVTITP